MIDLFNKAKDKLATLFPKQALKNGSLDRSNAEKALDRKLAGAAKQVISARKLKTTEEELAKRTKQLMEQAIAYEIAKRKKQGSTVTYPSKQDILLMYGVYMESEHAKKYVLGALGKFKQPDDLIENMAFEMTEDTLLNKSVWMTFEKGQNFNGNPRLFDEHTR